MPFAASFIALAAALAYLALGFAARRIFNRRRRASIPSDPEKALFTRALQFDDSEMEIQSTGCCGGGGDPRSLPESWTWSVLTASDDSLILRALSSNGGYFDYEIGPGGCLATIRTKEGTVLTAPTYRGEVNDRLACMIVLWGNGVTLDLPGRPNRRWNVNLGGTPRANAPVYAVEMSGDGRTLDVWSTAGDQFDPQLEGRMVTRLACRHRYQLEEDGVLMITRTMLFGATTVDGHPRDLNDMYIENWSTFSNSALSTFSPSLDSSGQPTSSIPLNKVPYYQNTPVSKTTNYFVVSNPSGPYISYSVHKDAKGVYNSMPFDKGSACNFGLNVDRIRAGDVLQCSISICAREEAGIEFKGAVEGMQGKVPGSWIGRLEQVEAGLALRLQAILDRSVGDGQRIAKLAPLLRTV